MPRRRLVLVAPAALLVLVGCAAPDPEAPVPGGAPSPLPTVVSSERLPSCSAIGGAQLRRLAKGVASPEVTVAGGASVAVPKDLRRLGYATLLGVTLGGPGVDGQRVVLAAKGDGRTLLALDDLARTTFPGWAQDEDSSSTGRYRAELARSDTNLDALACAAAAH